MSSKYFERSRWDWAYLVTCDTCGWYNLSQDFGFTNRSGVVHSEMLKPGHHVNPIEKVKHDREVYGED